MHVIILYASKLIISVFIHDDGPFGKNLLYIDKKGKVRPRTGHEGSEGECSFNLGAGWGVGV
jgi:hypothetical protein